MTIEREIVAMLPCAFCEATAHIAHVGGKRVPTAYGCGCLANGERKRLITKPSRLFRISVALGIAVYLSWFWLGVFKIGQTAFGG